MIRQQERTGDESQQELVLNISTFYLTDNQKMLLSKGLSFFPTYDTDWFKVEINLYSFFCKLRLKAFFSTHPSSDINAGTTENTGFNSKMLGLCPKSRFFPPQDNHIVDSYIKLVHAEIAELRRLEQRGRFSKYFV